MPRRRSTPKEPSLWRLAVALAVIVAVLYANKAGWFAKAGQSVVKNVTDDMMEISAKQRERQEAKLLELRMKRAAEKATNAKDAKP
jgi:Sec-independent protein translocase protein TatA